MKENSNKLFSIFLCCTFFFIFFSGPKVKLKSAEDLDISPGIALSSKKSGKAEKVYVISTSSKMYKEDGTIENAVKIGKGNNVGETRGDRQRKIGKEFFLGLSKVYMFDEKYAQQGITSTVDILFKNPIINDNAFSVVFKGNAEDYFKYNMGEYENSAEYISDMIGNLSNSNFFKKDYIIKDLMLAMDSEGRNAVIPYIIKDKEGIKVDGIAVFKKDRIGTILSMEDTRIMNMLRENKVKGVLTIQKSPKEYVNYETKTKRKVQCSKVGDNYSFIINLNLNGDIVNNELYKDISGKIEVTKKFEEDMAEAVEEMCYRFLDKMKKEYKLDCLQLGWIAAAKYGRDTGVDWDEIISKSDIKVNVKVHVDKLGRGQY